GSRILTLASVSLLYIGFPYAPISFSIDDVWLSRQIWFPPLFTNVGVSRRITRIGPRLEPGSPARAVFRVLGWLGRVANRRLRSRAEKAPETNTSELPSLARSEAP